MSRPSFVRRQALSLAAPDVLEALARALLSRPPTDAERAAWASATNAGSDLETLILESPLWAAWLDRQDETLAGQLDVRLAAPGTDAAVFTRNAPALVTALYEALLQRAPDAEGLATYGALQDAAGVGGLARSLGESPEHQARLLKPHLATLAARLYRSLLAREPTADERAAFATLRDGAAVAALAERLAASPEHTEALLAGASTARVAALFDGLLGRTPNPDELRSGLRAFVSATDWPGLVQRLIARPEHGQRVWSTQRVAAIAGSYRALVGREPTAAELTEAESVLATPADTERFLARLQDTDEYREALRRRGLFRARHADLINAVYTALLGRPVDAVGLANYGEWMLGPTELAQMIRALTESREYQRRQESLARHAPAHRSPATVLVEHAEAVFTQKTNRGPTLPELSQVLAGGELSGRTLPALVRGALAGRVLAPKRVLLFGAFGNGNAGDAFQALAVQRHLQAAWGLAPSQIFATSLIHSSDYPFPSAQKLPFGTIQDADLVNGFDALIIGGGGLLTHPHDPLQHADWVRQVHTPIAVHAVGAVEALVESHRALLSRAWSVTGRDAESVAALRRIRDDAALCRDPILCGAGLEGLLPDGAAPAPPALHSDVLWVLKHPTSPAEAELLRQLGEVMRATPGVHHRVLAIEPSKDDVLRDYFPEPVLLSLDVATIVAAVQATRLVVSMRYHGAIFAALAGKPSLGYAQKKIATLYDEMAIEGLYQLPMDALRDRIRALGDGSAAAAVPAALRDDHTRCLKALRTQLLL